ncbi:MAG: LemA family protein [Candidatus Pacebacteria bacterium]|nr:LemA family protein [Candidatus Paceibacterota bacterium]
MNPFTIVILAVLAVLVLWFIVVFNRLVILRTRSKEALSDIDVQTKRRYDLIPNLVETVKGYMQHERNVFENVTKARSEAMSAGDGMAQKAEKENALSNTLKTLFAVSENYPELKANENFLELQRELSDTENKIQAARRFYNGNVRDLNIKIETFPSRIVAGLFGFAKMEFFEVADEAEKQPVNVKF